MWAGKRARRAKPKTGKLFIPVQWTDELNFPQEVLYMFGHCSELWFLSTTWSRVFIPVSRLFFCVQRRRKLSMAASSFIDASAYNSIKVIDSLAYVWTRKEIITHHGSRWIRISRFQFPKSFVQAKEHLHNNHIFSSFGTASVLPPIVMHASWMYSLFRGLCSGEFFPISLFD